jgi:hypothetical protein
MMPALSGGVVSWPTACTPKKIVERKTAKVEESGKRGMIGSFVRRERWRMGE